MNTWDTGLFLILNGFHSPIVDQAMFWASNKLIWIPLYILLLFYIIKYYKKESIFIFIVVVALITISDQISVHAFKNVFLRLRPCHEPTLEGLVHIVNNKCGGDYGFYSSHASNHFALASFLIFFLSKKIKYFSFIILSWASLIAYSRIYLGVHYPGDVLAGAIAGCGLGLLMIKTYTFLSRKITQI